MHVDNLYKNQTVMLFKQCYAMEKIHGTSAHISWKAGKVSFFAGGASHLAFVKLFNIEDLTAKFTEFFGIEKDVTIFGEAYGGSMQAMSATYGKVLKFVAFEIGVGEHCFLNVKDAHELVLKMGLEFVDYAIIDCTVEALDREMMRDSVQAVRNGCGEGHKREGVVLRPLVEMRTSNGARVISKHKRADFQPERKNQPSLADPEKQAVLTEASEIADEWVTPGRLEHVLDKLFVNNTAPDITRMKDVLAAMVEDVVREAESEIVDSKEVRSAISRKTAQLFKSKLEHSLKDTGTV